MVNILKKEQRYSPQAGGWTKQNDKGRWHMERGDRLIRQGRYEEGMREYNKGFRLIIGHSQ